MTISRRTTPIAVVALAAMLAGCTADSGARTDSVAADSSVTGAGSPVDAPGVNVDANNTPPSPSDSPRADAVKGASFDGVPPLRIGMSAAEARAALGLPASSATSAECRYLDTKGRLHAFAMVVRDTVARIDVRDSTLATDAGARVGDAESRVLELYRGRVKTEPHKYAQGGHYFIIASPSDTTRQLVFETDGKRVTSYRVGRTPEVRWVEGCS